MLKDPPTTIHPAASAMLASRVAHGSHRTNGKCEKCGSKIEWAQTPGGKWLRLDPQPTMSRTLIVDHATRPYRIIGINEAGRQLSLEDQPGYGSHFATCRIGRAA